MVPCALLFFAYFGFADETIKNYRGAFNSIARRVGYTMAGSSGLGLTGDTMQKRDSFDSFSDMSASYGGVLPLEYDAEKTRVLGAGDYDGGEKLTLGDVS
ncbi:hypothetical protein B0H13DRAFT_2098813 [Mycena leptocephala]|nr:hypothetical protein B0H13DRAFT_2098813 [Mycena leptocephala]